MHFIKLEKCSHLNTVFFLKKIFFQLHTYPWTIEYCDYIPYTFFVFWFKQISHERQTALWKFRRQEHARHSWRTSGRRRVKKEWEVVLGQKWACLFWVTQAGVEQGRTWAVTHVSTGWRRKDSRDTGHSLPGSATQWPPSLRHPGDFEYLLPRLSLSLGDARQAGNHKFSPSPESSAPSGERTLLSTSCSIDICLVNGWREGWIPLL